MTCPTHTATFTPKDTRTRTPTETSTTTPTATPTSTETPLFAEIDPYKCYKAKGVGPIAKERIVTYTDEFETKRTRVLKPFMFCNPSAPSDPDIPLGDLVPDSLHEPESRLICYRIRDERKIDKQPKFAGKLVTLRTRVEKHSSSGVCCLTFSCSDNGDPEIPCTSCDSESSCVDSDDCLANETCTSIVEAKERYKALKPFLMCVPSVRDFP